MGSGGRSGAGRAKRALTRVPILAAASLLAIVAAALAYEPVGTDFRISQVGTDGDAAHGALDDWPPAVAYNPAANEFLVVWEADGLATDDNFQVFGQRVSATGTELGSDFRISHGGTDAAAGFNGEAPDIVYNPAANEYLVVWSGDGFGFDAGIEIFGQRITAAGEEAGSDDFRISDAGSGFTQEPAVAYNPVANEYLVTWESNDISPATLNDTEIFGQRLSALGAEVGTDDFRISNVGPEGEDLRRGSHSDVVYNPAENEYLVTWDGDDLPTPDETEIFGRQVGATGTLGSEVRISQVGTDMDATRGGFAPAIAYSPLANEYLVTWYADTATGEEEIFGQRLTAAAAEVGPNDFRISTTGTDGDTARRAFSPAVAYTPIGNEYVVTWYGDGLETNDENEIFGRRLSAAGAELGTDFRISNVGTDGNANRDGELPDIAYNSVADQFLVAWLGDGLATNDEFEVFGRRLALPAAPPEPPADTPPDDATPPDTQITAGPKKKERKGRASFSFTSTEAGSTFECRLDDGAFEPCTPPKAVTVKKGKHHFEVRARDAAGNVDPTPATRDWKVKKKKKKS